ncbi:ABC transporter ATP-binding protein [Candidatus Saccharibacteria bacterium]|nr:MAG: ABC transporter ATP-binding protein [Candidatus Saccharibacteria bacterium]
MAQPDLATPVIELRALTKRYGLGDACFNALDEVSLKIEKGEFIAIMGPSGCGKTTLLNVLGLLDSADEGEYLLDGNAIDRLGSAKHARVRSNQIGMVFQSFNLINRLTVLENVALPLTYKGLARTKRLERASEVLKQFHLQEREYYMPWQLSGGQMQRVAIARALVNEPSIILADEPTGNLDSRSSHVIMEELSELHKKGNTIIMVTHNPGLTSYASRVINMLDGRIASDTRIKVDTKDAYTVTKIPLNRRTNLAKATRAKQSAEKAKSPAVKRTTKIATTPKPKTAKKKRATHSKKDSKTS